MTAVRMWVGALGGLTRLRAEGIGGEGDTLMLKGILAASGLGMLVWARALLRAARLQAGDGQGWRAFREWGVPVVLMLRPWCYQRCESDPYLTYETTITQSGWR